MKSHGRLIATDSIQSDQGVISRVHFNMDVKGDTWVEFLNGVFYTLVLFFDSASLHEYLLRFVYICIVFLKQVISIVIAAFASMS